MVDTYAEVEDDEGLGAGPRAKFACAARGELGGNSTIYCVSGEGIVFGRASLDDGGNDRARQDQGQRDKGVAGWNDSKDGRLDQCTDR